tara:strand:+ start:1685 stop:2119 length:435 start_codon:yes stop_codon:yes gene_type:complete
MSILNKLASLSKTVVTDERVEMTEAQVAKCKLALRRDNRGYNVFPNQFDVKVPYRVTIRGFDQKWANYGAYVSADVAAAVGTIVSAAYYGAKAKAGSFDAAVVEADPEFALFLANPRYADIISKANGEGTTMLQDHYKEDVIPF